MFQSELLYYNGHRLHNMESARGYYWMELSQIQIYLVLEQKAEITKANYAGAALTNQLI